MTIEDLLSQLEAERAELEIRYRDYYKKAAETNREIKGWHFLSPDDIPIDLIRDHEKYAYLHAEAVADHNSILNAIDVIKKRVS